MYKNNFVLAIKDNNGNTLRENSSGQVFLPFGSEYKLFLKNNAWTRALVKIKIDGTDITGNSGLVIGASSETDLERFIIDGNLNSGRKFKFVSSNDVGVANPFSGDNGIIEVSVQLEKVIYYINSSWTFGNYIPFGTGSGSTTDFYSKLYKYKHENINDFPDGHSSSCFCSNTVGNSTVKDQGISFGQFCVANDSYQKGATVEGGLSHQSFTTTTLGELEPTVTVLRLQLISPREISVPVTTSDTRKVFCSNCRSKVRWNDQYCWKCGEKLVHNDMLV